MILIINHPAKYSEGFTKIFAEILQEYDCHSVLDPFAGTGKIGEIKQYGFNGIVIANEIESEWLEDNSYNCDMLMYQDAEYLILPHMVDAIVTSPTYGNRMADHHNAKDNSKRITYTHYLGHELNTANTGKMQWGKKYRDKHTRIYQNLFSILKPGGLFVLNMSNHIRKGEEQYVTEWHINILENIGFKKIKEIKIPTKRMKFGKNNQKRVSYESIIILERT